MRNVCEVKDCNKYVEANRLCSAHNNRLRRHGDVQEHIPLYDRSVQQTATSIVCSLCKEDKPKSDYGKANLSTCSSCVLIRRRALLYKMTPEQLLEFIKVRENKCQVCNKTEPKMHIDHDHSCCPGKSTCGKCVRGLLCPHCNLVLGLFGDDLDRFKAAVVYLSQPWVESRSM